LLRAEALLLLLLPSVLLLLLLLQGLLMHLEQGQHMLVQHIL
jgi:hypothetical protein